MGCICTGIRGSRMWWYLRTHCIRRSINSFKINFVRIILSLFLHSKISSYKYAKVAHLVERDLAKVEVAGSSPVFRS